MGAARTATLLALRERELGFSDSGYLARARTLAAALPEVDSSLTRCWRSPRRCRCSLVEASACLEVSNRDLGWQIEKLRLSDDPPERVVRQIARREKQIAQQERMLVTSWFNLAVASYNLQRHTEARQFAEKVVSDEQFGERAREILARLKPSP